MVGHVGKVFDVGRVAPLKIAAQLLHVRNNAQVAVRLGVAFPPAADTRVGVHLDEQPILPRARIDQEVVHSGNLHALDSPVVPRRFAP